MGAKSTKRKKKQEQNIDTMEQDRNEPYYNVIGVDHTIIRSIIEARRQPVSSYTTGQEKCYDPRDRTLTFVDGDDDLDCK